MLAQLKMKLRSWERRFLLRRDRIYVITSHGTIAIDREGFIRKFSSREAALEFSNVVTQFDLMEWCARKQDSFIPGSIDILDLSLIHI